MLVRTDDGSLLDISNWRVYQKLERGISVTLSDCTVYYLQLLEDEIIPVSNNECTLERKFFIVGHKLPCPRCEGRGTIDWIRKITKDENIYNLQEYRRDKNKPLRIFQSNFYSFDQFVVSFPEVLKYYEVCPKCFGSGLNFLKCYKEVIDG